MSVFTQQDYESNNGMQPHIWGPPIWHTLHTISFNYPVKPTTADKKNYTAFVLSFEYVLPCIYCRINFKKNLKNANFNPACMESRSTFSRFIYDLHNCVNDMLGKNIKISYEEVRDRYEHFRSRCSEKEIKADILKQQSGGKEKSCNSSLYGNKAKCVIHIVPRDMKTEGFKINPKCKAKKTSNKSTKKNTRRLIENV
jgi:hypothetical protein